MKRKHYTQEQKEAILARYAVSTKQLKDFLIDEGVPKSTFTQWLRKYEGQSSNDSYTFTPMNFRHLIKKNHHLHMRLMNLKRSVSF